jgi:hypothetical protein
MKHVCVAMFLLLCGSFSTSYGQKNTDSIAISIAMRGSLFTGNVERDTLDKAYKTYSDSVEVDSDTEKGGDEKDQVWNVSSGTHYYSRYTRYGIDMSEDKSALSIESEIGHVCGLSAGFEAFTLTGTNGGYDHSALHAGYEYPLDTSLSLAGIYTYSSYKSDTMNVLAGIANTVSFIGTYKVNGFNLFASYTTFFGGGTANYVTAGASEKYKIGQLTLEPSVQLCFASQTVSDSLLPKNRGKGKGDKNGTGSTLTTTITGLSNLTLCAAFHYPLGNGFVASIVPSYVYSPTDLAISKNQFVLTIGVEHSIDF